MPTHRTRQETPTPQSPESPESPPAAPPVVPQRSARRATARRAHNRRVTARLHKDDVDERIAGFLEAHPDSTTGEIAKGLDADRGTVAAVVSHLARASELADDDATERSRPEPPAVT